jgi:hypothetical protein
VTCCTMYPRFLLPMRNSENTPHSLTAPFFERLTKGWYKVVPISGRGRPPMSPLRHPAKAMAPRPLIVVPIRLV